MPLQEAQEALHEGRRAAPMPDGLSKDINNGEVNPRDDFKTRARYLADKYYYDITEAR